MNHLEEQHNIKLDYITETFDNCAGQLSLCKARAGS